MKKYLSILCILVCSSCESEQDKIITYIENNCDFRVSDTSLIDLGNFTKTKVDRIYLFDAETNANDISLALGFEYKMNSNIQNETKRLVFTYKKKLVKVLDIDNSSIYFEKSDSVFSKNGNHLYYCSVFKDTKFYVIRRLLNSLNKARYFYKLKPT